MRGLFERFRNFSSVIAKYFLLSSNQGTVPAISLKSQASDLRPVMLGFYSLYVSGRCFVGIYWSPSVGGLVLHD